MKDRQPIHGSGLIAFILQCVDQSAQSRVFSLNRHSDFRIWPRISPPGFADVWRLKYHLPFTSSLACSGVRVAVPSMGLVIGLVFIGSWGFAVAPAAAGP